MPHPHMVFDLEECEQYSSLNNKTTAIIATGQAHINFLMWSIFSILLRSKVGSFLEHINVSINGPDKRQGDPSIGNKKQAFLEELRNLKWVQEDGKERDMPLTVIRVWSRVGAEQAVEMAIPWVHTDSYIYIHDDTIWLTKDWEEGVMSELYKPDVAMVYSPPFETAHLSWSKYEGQPKLNFPHTICACMICRKPIFAKHGIKWTGYHFKNDINLRDKLSGKIDDFLNAHKPMVMPLVTNYNYISYDVGSWAYYSLRKNGYKINPVKDLKIHHFGSMSWNVIAQRIADSSKQILELEEDLKKIPQYWNLYNKYKSSI